MKYINSLLKRANQITSSKDLKGLMVLLNERDGKYYDKEEKEFVIPKEEDGHMYIIFTSFKNK